MKILIDKCETYTPPETLPFISWPRANTMTLWSP